MNRNHLALSLLLVLFTISIIGCNSSVDTYTAEDNPGKTKLYDFSANLLGGEEISLDRFRGKVVLVVNTASLCAYTSQYGGLETLYKKYKDRGFEVIGFPCNQFRNQEPGTAEEIRRFCQDNYSLTFTMFDKIEVNGPQAHPLYKWLTKEVPNHSGTIDIPWNFTKFLIDRKGNPVWRFTPMTPPESLTSRIEKLL